MVILRYFAGLMAWLTILLVNVALCGIAIYCFSEAGLLGDNAFASAVSSQFGGIGDPTVVQRSTWKWIAIAAAVVAGVVLLVSLLMISRIRIAIACIKARKALLMNDCRVLRTYFIPDLKQCCLLLLQVASQAVGAMPSILLFPLLPFALLVGLVVYWVSVTAMLYTAGTMTANCREPSSHQSFGFSSLGSFTPSSASGSFNSTTGTVNCYTNITG